MFFFLSALVSFPPPMFFFANSPIPPGPQDDYAGGDGGQVPPGPELLPAGLLRLPLRGGGGQTGGGGGRGREWKFSAGVSGRSARQDPGQPEVLEALLAQERHGEHGPGGWSQEEEGRERLR